MYIFGSSPDPVAPINAFPCFICKKMIINAGLIHVICSTADGASAVFAVDDWARDWREGDILDDTHQYG
jgi:dCMP deaminase